MKRSTSQIYNDLILSYVIFNFNKLGLFSRIKNDPGLESILEGFDKSRATELIRVAEIMNLISIKGSEVYLTELGNDVYKNRGFFTWAIGGYSPLFEEMDTFLKNPETSYGNYIRGNFVAIGSDEANQGLMKDIFTEIIGKYDFGCVADLGCGNAGRLIGLLKNDASLNGVGIDINPAAIEVAKRLTKENGLENRLDLICENVFETLEKPYKELEEVEFVTSFMMLHDLFNINKIRGSLFKNLRSAFPNAKYFLFADTCKSDVDYTSETMPVFTMGYELLHVMRGIELFTLDYYNEQFENSGLTLVEQVDFGVPNTYLFILKSE